MCYIKIGNIVLNKNSKPYIIAEAGVNYENSLDTAKEMVREASKAGAHAIKFQTYKSETIAAKDSPAYWDTQKTQREFFKKYDSFNEDEYIELKREADKWNITFLSTPFDFKSVDYLDNLMPAYKIASADITNIPFLKYIAKKNKPILLSTGASTIYEIDKALSEIKNAGNNNVALLHCILSYPTKYDDANLGMIKHLQNIFPNNIIGYSDHTKPDKGMIVLIIAVLMGAVILEKHFTLDKTLPGNDHYHAMDPEDLKLLSQNLDILSKVIGKTEKAPIESETLARQYARRSIVAKQIIHKGTKISHEHLTTKRPGTGISPEFYEFLIGKKIKKHVKEDEILDWEMFFDV